jgi:hypothetical protein
MLNSLAATIVPSRLADGERKKPRKELAKRTERDGLLGFYKRLPSSFLVLCEILAAR